jgi:hypothetical protein
MAAPRAKLSRRRQTLSVCCLTNAPGPLVRGALEPFREIADEIVIAAGGRVAGEDLQCYGEVADVLFHIEFDFMERHLAWLHAQCGGDWILRLDGDEIPSAAMVAEVGRAKDDRSISSVFFARRHPFPTPERYIVQEPWYPDFQARMVRNDGTARFSGLLHTAAERTLPARLVAAPLYHLSLIAADYEERRARAERYEQLRPGLIGPGGLPSNDALLPERLAELRTAPTPAADRELVEAVMSAERPPAGPVVGPVRRVALAEMDPLWANRPIPHTAYHARLEVIGEAVPFAPGEQRPMYFRVCNEGSETWPWDGSVGPHIHLIHRVVDPKGGYEGDWQPALFTEWVSPAATTVVPAIVVAPAVPGSYRLEAKLRHAPLEHVFGVAATVDVVVREGGAWGALH